MKLVNDLFFYLTAILLENHVIFCSNNITLLTNTIMTLMALIKPFKYIYRYMENIMKKLQKSIIILLKYILA